MTKAKSTTKAKAKTKPQEKKILLGHVGVDSGQLLITDPCYLHDWKDNPPEGEERPCKGLYSYSYDGACSATGAKGKALFHPLRLALTGRESGPEFKALLPLMDRDRVLARLQGKRA